MAMPKIMMMLTVRWWIVEFQIHWCSELTYHIPTNSCHMFPIPFLIAVVRYLARVDRVIPPGIRCTVKIDPKSYPSPHSSKKGTIKGRVVSPTSPRDEAGIYWGYTTRLAASIGAIFDECPYEGGYDVKVGTSERGDVSIDDYGFCLKKKQPSGEKTNNHSDSRNDSRFDHLLIVFGGVAGIEESVDADESMKLSGEDSKKMFDVW